MLRRLPRSIRQHGRQTPIRSGSKKPPRVKSFQVSVFFLLGHGSLFRQGSTSYSNSSSSSSSTQRGVKRAGALRARTRWNVARGGRGLCTEPRTEGEASLGWHSEPCRGAPCSGVPQEGCTAAVQTIAARRSIWKSNSQLVRAKECLLSHARPQASFLVIVIDFAPAARVEVPIAIAVTLVVAIAVAANFQVAYTRALRHTAWHPSNASLRLASAIVPCARRPPVVAHPTLTQKSPGGQREP